MEKWRRIWREGFAPHLSRTGLLALQAALRSDDARLVQGAICCPPALDAWRNRAIKGTCAIGFCGWQGEGFDSVGEVEEYFHRVCDAAESACDEVAACRYFLNWFDETPRERMRRELLTEVLLALRQGSAAAA